MGTCEDVGLLPCLESESNGGRGPFRGRGCRSRGRRRLGSGDLCREAGALSREGEREGERAAVA